MIEMACPNCGRRGKVPFERLGSRLHCKKCDAFFRLDATGRAVLDDPRARNKLPPRPRAARNTRADEDVFDSLKGLARGGKVLLALGLVAFLGYGILSHLLGGRYSLPPGVAPDSLEGRTTVAAEAFVSKDTSTLKHMAASGTESELVEWYNTVRPSIGDYKAQEPGYDVAVAIMSMGARNKTEGATSSAEAALVFPSKPGEVIPEHPYTLRLPWKCESDEWRLDGKLLRQLRPKGR
jgi:hypothetical protein